MSRLNKIQFAAAFYSIIFGPGEFEKEKKCENHLKARVEVSSSQHTNVIPSHARLVSSSFSGGRDSHDDGVKSAYAHSLKETLSIYM